MERFEYREDNDGNQKPHTHRLTGHGRVLCRKGQKLHSRRPPHKDPKNNSNGNKKGGHNK